MKNIKTTLRHFYNCIYIGITCALFNINPIFADPESTSEPPTVAEQTIFTAGESIVSSLTTTISDFYTQKCFPLLLVVNLVLLAFTKNEKRVELYKKSLVVICVVYVLLRGSALITSTLDSILSGAGVI